MFPYRVRQSRPCRSSLPEGEASGSPGWKRTAVTSARADLRIVGAVVVCLENPPAGLADRTDRFDDQVAARLYETVMTPPIPAWNRDSALSTQVDPQVQTYVPG